MSSSDDFSLHKRRRVGYTSSSTGSTYVATPQCSNITIDLTQDDDDSSHSFAKSDVGESRAMTYDNDEALAKALQEEYDAMDGEPPQLEGQPQARCPAPGREQDDEEYARQLQAQFDNEDQVINSEPSHEQPFFTNQDDEAFARMLQDQEDRDRDIDDTVVPSPNNVHVPPPSSTYDEPASGDNRVTSEFTQSTSKPALQAKEVEQTVREFAQPIAKLKCDKCGKPNLRAERDILAVYQSILEDAGRSHSIACPKCGMANTKIDRARLIWLVLCGFDAKSKANEPDKKKRAKTSDLKAPFLAQGSGTGYGGNRKYSNRYDNFGSFSGQSASSYGSSGQLGRPSAATKKPLDLDDVMTAQAMNSLAALLPSFERESEFDLDPPTKIIQALLLCSSMMERAAELFRNNSLEDITARRGLYTSLARFVQTLASHHSTSALVFGERVIRSPGTGLLKVSLAKQNLVSTDDTDTTQPLTKCLKDLSSQCTIMLQSKDSEPEDVQLFRTIKELYDFLHTNIGTILSTNGSVANNAWMKELAVSDVPDESIISIHSLVSKQAGGDTMMPGRVKRIIQEIARLQASLPENIFFRYASSRPDVMKFLIVGPQDTPYENGLFEFDMLCGANFPTSPPSVEFRTTGGGIVAFNPNLYNNGKVCLSLLGTWSGEPWQPNVSTLLQVIVSIQAMIFCEKPWYNEPGRETMPNGDKQSETYNKNLYPHTVQTAMIDWLERRRYGLNDSSRFSAMRAPTASSIGQHEDIWDEVVRRHFATKQNEIITTVSKWVCADGFPNISSSAHGVHYGATLPTSNLTSSPFGSGPLIFGQPPAPLFASGTRANQAPAFTGTGRQDQTLGGPPFAPSAPTTSGMQNTAAIPTTSNTLAATLSGDTLLEKLRGVVEKLKKNAASSTKYGHVY